MYELCLDPETARQLANRNQKMAAQQPDTLPETAPEAAPTATEERPVPWSRDPRYAAAFAMILYWSQHGGC